MTMIPRRRNDRAPAEVTLVKTRRIEMSVAEQCRRLVAFLRRQPRDIWTGGWPVLRRKLLMTLDVALAVPLVLAARLLRPVVLIRFGGLPTAAIGHLAFDMEFFLCRRDAGWYGPHTIDLFCCALPVCNQQLKRMWERTVHVSRFTLAAERVNRYVPNGWGNRIPFGLIPSDTNSLFATTPPHLSFTPEEQRQGADALRRLGVPEGQPFVCFHARDVAYYVEQSRRKSLYRNSEIQTYRPAVEALAQRGYVLLRLGAAVERPLPIRDSRIIDYATTARTDFMDIFLCAHCHFYLGDGAGLFNVPLIFRRPVVLANYIPFEYTTTWSPSDLFIPKTMWLRSESRLMTFGEILRSGAGRFLRDDQYEQQGIEVINNTPEEIAALALEMEARIADTWQTTEEDEELQRRFWEIFQRNSTFYASAPWRTHWRIGTGFLRQHRALLEPNTRPSPTMAQVRAAR